MVDETMIRRQLAEFQSRLARLDDERGALLDIVKGYEALLRATSDLDHISTGPITFPKPAVRSANSKPVGEVSMRSAVAQVVREAGGPLHTKEIMRRAQAMGATTNAKVPLSVVDLVLINLQKKGRAERTAPRTWRWTDMDRPGATVPVASRPTD